MAYQALYRKFRPLYFEDVKGQDAIVTTLKNQIRAERIGHAYLFCGTRGTGKTTLAKIFARAVNCQQPVDGSPCGECETCQSIRNQTSMNVIEIDAASNNGVDNIREIVDEVQYSPTEGKYKVYIIDEVHMLSTGAFNALLKTLEEPPEYVIFILATTEAHKIPITILSRCQRYDFKRITIDTIADQLRELLEKENVEAEEKAVRYIAKAADGSMRDGLSLLDQCIAFYLGETLTYDKVLEVLGAVDTEVFNRLFEIFLKDQPVEALELLEELVMEGRDLPQFITDFTWYLRNLLLVKTSEQALSMVDASGEQAELYKKYAGLVETETLIRYIQSLSEASNQIRYASQKRVLLELTLIRLLRPEMEQSYDAVLDRLGKLERQVQNGITGTALAAGPLPEAAGQPPISGVGISKAGAGSASPEALVSETAAQLLEAAPEDLKLAAANWSGILAQLPMSMQSMLNSAKPGVGEGGELLLVFTDEMEKEYMDHKDHLGLLEQTIAEKIQREVKIRTQYISPRQEAADAFVDLRKLVKMQIEFED